MGQGRIHGRRSVLITGKPLRWQPRSPGVPVGLSVAGAVPHKGKFKLLSKGEMFSVPKDLNARVPPLSDRLTPPESLGRFVR